MDHGGIELKTSKLIDLSRSWVPPWHPGCHNQRRRATISLSPGTNFLLTLLVPKNMVLKVLLVNGSWSDGSRFAAARFLASAAVHVLRATPMSSKGKSDCKLKVKAPLQFSSSAPPPGTQTTDPAKVVKQAADGERCRHWQRQQQQGRPCWLARLMPGKTLAAGLILSCKCGPLWDALFSKLFGTRIRDIVLLTFVLESSSCR